MKKNIKVGIIGLGRIGKLRMALVRKHPKMKLSGICDVNSTESSSASGCKFYSDADHLLSSGIDAVFVCTPNLYTPSLIVRALEKGIHVFAEKPPGRNLEDMHTIMAAEKKNPHLKLKFGFNHRYHDGIREAKAIVDGQNLGRILWMRGVYGKSGGVGFERGWRSDRNVAGGGILLDQGIHMLDLFNMFCGEFDDVKSLVSNSYWKLDVEDNAFAILRNKKDQVAMLHSSSTHWRHTFLMEIYLTDGYVAVKGILSNSRTYGQETLITARRQFEGDNFQVGNPREEITTFDKDMSWEREIDEFADCVISGKRVQVGTSTDAYKAMDLVYRIYRGDPKWWSVHSNEKSQKPDSTETARKEL